MNRPRRVFLLDPRRSLLALRLLLLAGCVVAAAACDTAEAPSLYDPIEDGTYQSKPDPRLTSIVPASGEAIAGVSDITLMGSNFVPSAESTFVYFNGTRYPVKEITPTSITMRAPNIPAAGIEVKISVLRAEHFSDVQRYDLLPAVTRLGEIRGSENPRSIASDANGNAYVSYIVDGADGGIRKVAPDGTSMVFATPAGTVYPALTYGDTRGLLGVRNVRAVFSLTEGSTSSGRATTVFADRTLRLRALDVDDAGVLWTGGFETGVLYRVGVDGSVTEIPVDGDVLAVEARMDTVYVSLLGDEPTPRHRIVRFDVTSASVGPAEVVADIWSQFPDVQVSALAFTAGGDLIMGTTMRDASAARDNPTPLLELPAGGALAEFYDGLLVGDVTGLAWGQGTLLYAAGPRILTDDNSMQTVGDLVVVNTLRQGER